MSVLIEKVEHSDILLPVKKIDEVHPDRVECVFQFVYLTLIQYRRTNLRGNRLHPCVLRRYGVLWRGDNEKINCLWRDSSF